MRYRTEETLQHTTSQNIQVDRIQDYAQALIKINQLSKPSMHLASESDDEVCNTSVSDR